jgi:hypothetical protein
MAKKKAVVKKVGSKVTPKKAGSRNKFANPTQIPLDSSAHIKFGELYRSVREAKQRTFNTVTTRATALDCAGNRFDISNFDINATLDGQSPSISMILVDVDSENRSEADITFEFMQLDDPGVRESELVITVLTRKTRTLQF